ncbi:MAG: hypothetical protein JWO11_3058 [Nocardioides sp.]|nr:hypothetical protein [Nocardioides sp.]
MVLHIGLPKTGTTYLQALLADNRDRLRAGGVLYPFLGPGAMFRGAVEVRASHDKFGLGADEVAGTWRALCERARAYPGTTVISHEVLAGSTLEQIAAATAPLAGLELHVVVTARDLGRQAIAHWQEEVKLGDTRSFADFEREQFRADTGPDTGPDAGGVRPHFWHAQDFADALRRWSTAVPPQRVHLVVGPAPGAAPDELWRRFADGAGIDWALVDAGAADPANPSLGAAEIRHLRAVNAALDRRLDARSYNRLVKRRYAEGVLARRPGAPPRTPASLGPLFQRVTRGWLADVTAAGHPVHGNPLDLLPVLAQPGDAHPDLAAPGERFDATAADLAERFVGQADDSGA